MPDDSSHSVWIAIIGSITTIVVAIISRQADKAKAKAEAKNAVDRGVDPRTFHIRRPSAAFVSVFAIGIGLTALVVSLFGHPHGSFPDDSSQSIASGLEQLPLGTIAMWPLDEPPNDKWLICNNQVVPVDACKEFVDLFRKTSLASDNGNVVRVPDLRGVFIRGADDRMADNGAVDTEPGVVPRHANTRQTLCWPTPSFPDLSGLRADGGILMRNGKMLLMYSPDVDGLDIRPNKADDIHKYVTFWASGGEPETYQRDQSMGSNVRAMGISGSLGSVTWTPGEPHPPNVALNFIIRVKP